MRRRTFLGAAAAAALGGRVAAAQPAPWSAGSEAPTLKAPPGTTDCHHYIYDPRFPNLFVQIDHPDRVSPEDYQVLMRRLGIERHVVIQPSTYGTDNRCLLAALQSFGAAARGIAVVDPEVDAAELARLDKLGVRGLRVNLAPAGATTAAMIAPLARRAAAVGWHIEANVWAADLPGLLPTLGGLPAPLVLERFGHVPEPEGVRSPVFDAIRRLIDGGNTWVKLSAPYDASKSGPPNYDDTGALARAYVKAAPERLVWGSNWPHPGEKLTPDDAQMFDLLRDWAPDETVRRRILVENPETLYGFPAVA